jgi:molybdopterin synthase sulfur carrier subunit
VGVGAEGRLRAAGRADAQATSFWNVDPKGGVPLLSGTLLVFWDRPFLVPPSVEIRTLFFASYRELLGTKELAVDLPEGATVSDLVSSLRSRGGAFTVLPGDPAVAVNHAYADPTALLNDGDEVALIPPVAGG